MSSITQFLTSPALIDSIVVFLILETAVLCSLRARSSMNPWYAPVARNAAGIFLLLGLRSVIANAAASWLLLALLGAFFAHLLDVRTQLPGDAADTVPQPKEAP